MDPSNKILATVFCFTLSVGASYSQEDSSGSAKDNRPVRSPFENGTLLNNQTVVNLQEKTLEMMIQHRFGTFEKGAEDKFGIFGPSNIRFGFDYGITGRIQAGIGTTKNNMLEDVRYKIAVLRQTRSGSIPVSVSYFGSINITSKKDSILYPEFLQRLSYFHQIIIARKISSKISIQAAPGYVHYNIVDSALGTRHDNIAISFSGRVKISAQSSVLFDFDYPVTNASKEEWEAKPNAGIGLEVATSSHAFHVFIGTSSGILNAENIVYNRNDFTKPKEGLLIGFNITRSWNF